MHVPPFIAESILGGKGIACMVLDELAPPPPPCKHVQVQTSYVTMHGRLSIGWLNN